MIRILSLLFLFPLAATAQNVASDTTYNYTEAGKFYTLTRINFDDGTYQINTRLLGDTAALVSSYQAAYQREARTIARLVEQLQAADRTFTRMIREDAEIAAQTGTAPIVAIQQGIDSTFLVDVWVLDDGATQQAITFNRTAAGKLRLNIAGSNRIAHLFGDAMRILSTPATGVATNFYRINANTWSDANRRLFLRRTEVRYIPWQPTE
jgi:hypothetical protein